MFWNVLYDGLLSLEMPIGVELIAFADDVALVSSATVPVQLEENLADAFQIVQGSLTCCRK